METGATKAYQDKVTAEKAELDVRLSRLTEFLNTTTFDALPPAEQRRLFLQQVFMGQYSTILGERIAAF
jgi:hypothetical protein